MVLFVLKVAQKLARIFREAPTFKNLPKTTFGTIPVHLQSSLGGVSQFQGLSLVVSNEVVHLGYARDHHGWNSLTLKKVTLHGSSNLTARHEINTGSGFISTVSIDGHAMIVAQNPDSGPVSIIIRNSLGMDV